MTNTNDDFLAVDIHSVAANELMYLTDTQRTARCLMPDRDSSKHTARCQFPDQVEYGAAPLNVGDSASTHFVHDSTAILAKRYTA